MIIGYLLFVRYFLDLPDVSKKVDKVFQYLLYFYTGIIAIDLLLRLLPKGYQYSFSLYTGSRVLSFILFFGIIVYLISNYKNVLFRYVLAGTVLLMIPLTLTLLFHLTTDAHRVYSAPMYKVYKFDYFSFPLYTTRVGIILETICFYMGLGYLSKINQEKIKHLESEKSKSDQQLANLKTRTHQSKLSKDHFLKIANRNGFETIKVADILYCKAESNMCSIYLADETKKMVSKTLKEIIEDLPEDELFRIHRSYTVRLEAVTSFHHKNNGGTVVMSNGKKLSVSRTYKADFLNVYNPSIK